MHPSIEKNLPGFLFPHVFAEQLPKDLEPVAPTAEERHRVIEAMLSIQGHPADYMYSMKAQIVNKGKVRDFRRAPDGTMFARIDSLQNTCKVTPYLEVQMALLIDSEWRVVGYTNFCDELKRRPTVWMHTLVGSPTMVNEDNLDVVRSEIEQMRPKECLRLDTPEGIGGCTFYCAQDNPRRYFVHFAVLHLPWDFGLRGLELSVAQSMAYKYVLDGLDWLMRNYDWQFYDSINDNTISPYHMGIYNRLLFHRYMAEYRHDLETLKLLDAAEVFEAESDPLWMSRTANTEWREVLASLHRQATAPNPVSHYGQPLTPLDVHRVLLFCRLEGYVP